MTIEEANALVPRLAHLVGRQLLLAGEIEARLKKLAELGQPVRPGPRGVGAVIEERADDGEDVRAVKRELGDRVTAYEDGWRDVQALGAVVKDPRVGLVDFYGRVEGKLVWLCWKYGEVAIEFYHDLDTGFSGRKPLTGVTRQRMLN